MAKTTKNQAPKQESKKEKKPFWNPRNKMFVGVILVLFSFALLLSFISYFIYGYADQSILTDFADRDQKAKNWLGKFGAFLADFFLYKGFGIASFLYVRLFFVTGTTFLLDIPLAKLRKIWFWDLFVIVVLSVLFGFFNESLPELGGVFGLEMNHYLQDYIGQAGTILIVLLGVLIYLIFKVKVSPDKVKDFVNSRKKEVDSDIEEAKSENNTSISNT